MLLALVADHNTETDGTRRQELIWTPMLVVKPKCPYQVECMQRTLETITEKSLQLIVNAILWKLPYSLIMN